MSRSFRLLLVDDSAVVRTLLARALSAHPELHVVASAANGVLALAKLETVTVDAVVLDVDMPEMDGITTLKHLRARHPQLPVVMFSSLTDRGASATLDALAAGANDYALKPSAGEKLEDVVAQTLVPKLLSLRGGRAPTPLLLQGLETGSPRALPAQGAPGSRDHEAAPTAALTHAARTGDHVRVVAIAASTGGPNALAELLSSLPGSLPVPILIAQHMPPLFTRSLAERLAARSELCVCESAGGEALTPGHVYIAPGNQHLEVVRQGATVLTRLSSAPPENSCRPAADVLFRSLARVYGAGVLALVLTGMGQDGAKGAREIHAAGGRVLVQSGPTCVVWGMPKAVEEAGLAEAVVPLGELAAAVMKRVGNGIMPALGRGRR
jgi:two-component system chemotaxis response regulator CheB